MLLYAVLILLVASVGLCLRAMWLRKIPVGGISVAAHERSARLIFALKKPRFSAERKPRAAQDPDEIADEFVRSSVDAIDEALRHTLGIRAAEIATQVRATIATDSKMAVT